MAFAGNDSNKPVAETESPAPIPALIDFQHINVMRGDKLALNDLTLRISQKEHVAILGPNGCGKSTLIKTITRDCYPLAREGYAMSTLGQERWNIFELRA